jgi:hypothetical protein
MMRNILIPLLVLGVFLLNVSLVSADGNHQQAFEEGKKLVESNADCSELTDEQLEAIGEYFMEQMHSGEQHNAMHEMMGIEEGTEYHEQFHVNIAKMMYCGEGGMMGSGGMMGMMNMMGGDTVSGQATQTNMMQAMMGTFGYNSLYWNVVNVLYLILLIGLTILVYLGIIKLWKSMKKGGKK